MSKNLGLPQKRSAHRHVPEEIQHTRGGYPTGDPKPMFRLAHLPTRWRVLCGKVVPDLSKIALSAGSQNVVRVKGGALDTSLHRTSLTDRGFTLIPYDSAPDGESYMDEYEVRQPNKPVMISYCSCFETPVEGSSDLDLDEEALADWLTSLVDSGLISKPAPSVLRKKALSVRKRLAKAEGEVAHGQGAKALYVEELRAELAAWESALKTTPRVRGASVNPDTIDASEAATVEPAPVSRKK